MPNSAAAKHLLNNHSGPRGGFRTDAAISNSRLGVERTLKPWVPDSTDEIDGSLESSTNAGPWDQFAENERRFGIKTDYDENIYTTAIDKNHPQYRDRMAAAEKKAREIERSVPTTAHVAEERIMDHVAGDGRGDDEEEKYLKRSYLRLETHADYSHLDIAEFDDRTFPLSPVVRTNIPLRRSALLLLKLQSLGPP